jgi:hypothetical protein
VPVALWMMLNFNSCGVSSILRKTKPRWQTRDEVPDHWIVAVEFRQQVSVIKSMPFFLPRIHGGRVRIPLRSFGAGYRACVSPVAA